MRKNICKVVNCLILIILIIGVNISCKNRKRDENESFLKSIVDNTLGEKLKIPDSLTTFKPFSSYISDSTEMQNANFKIYSQINVSCSTCIEDIELWNNLISEFLEYKVPVFLICGSKDRFELIKYLFEEGAVKGFSYPLYFDHKNEFLKLNEFMNENNQFETVLTDKENTILLLGNPIRSEEMKKLYIRELQKGLKNQSELINVEGRLLVE